MADLNVLDSLTRKVFMPGMADGIFMSGPTLAYLKANCLKTWPGGGVSTFQEDFIYRRMNGSWLSAEGGDTFDITQLQIENGLTWTPRAAQVSVSADLRKLNLEYTGEGAYFDYVDSRLQTAALTMSEALAIALFKDGQSAGRTTRLNGLDEALSDGTNNGYQAQTYATYGTVTRANVNNSLNSPMTAPTANVAGAITYPLLEQAYSSVTYGREEPNLIVTTQLGLSYIKMAFQAQQRFQTQEAKFGFNGIQFNNATILADRYAPGTSALTSTSPGALGEFNHVASGETVWFLNVSRDNMGLYLSSNDLMGFGFTGWKVAADNLNVAGQYLFAGNFTVRQPRFSRYLFGITG